MDEMSVFASTILNQKYAQEKQDGTKETWPEIAARVGKTVLKSVKASKSQIDRTIKLIEDRKFIPGGRYLYATGRPYHQVNNCILLRAADSREGWAELLQNASMALMTGAGIGIDYSDIRGEGKPIRKTGGLATGPLALAEAVNCVGRAIKQGGSRRSAIWAGLSWSHPDIHKFITFKNWSPEVRDMKSKDFNFPATMDGTNISVQLNDDFFKAYHDEKNPLHAHAQSVYWATVKQMLKTSEPGFSVDTGKNSKETLRNAPVSGNTFVLTSTGYKRILDIEHIPVVVWTGKQWAQTTFTKTRQNDEVLKITLTGRRELISSKDHEFFLWHGGKKKAGDLKKGDGLLRKCGIILGGKQVEEAYLLAFVYGDGTFHQRYPRAEAAMCGEKEKLLSYLSTLPCEIGKDKRGILRAYYKNNDIFRQRDKTVFPEDVYSWNLSSRANFLSGLLDADGDDSCGHARLSSTRLDFLKGVSRLCDTLNLTSYINKGSNGGYSGTPSWNLIIKGKVCGLLNTHRLTLSDSTDSGYEVVSVESAGLEDVFCCDVKVSEHSFQAEGIIISNCTELTSVDTDDVCNLGSINLARIGSLEEMEEVVELATAFLLAGTVYSDVPYAKIDQVRTKNRRLGLGLMGLHEWLLVHGKKYNPDSELGEYLGIYTLSSKYAEEYAHKWDLSVPIKTRAIAPVGSIGILGETSTGIEPLFCVAYKRRYMKGNTWHYQYVVDPTAKRLIDKGVDPEAIEDAYSLAEDVERRVAFQAWVQKFVDHSISSTINLPAWGSELNNDGTVQKFGNMLIKYLPELRGITCYPDGGRAGQPLTPVSFKTAMKHTGEIFIEAADICEISGKGGSCGA